MKSVSDPSGGEIRVEDQPITVSPENSTPVPASARHRWFDMCPGVCTASIRQSAPATAPPSPSTISGLNPASTPSPPAISNRPARSAICAERPASAGPKPTIGAPVARASATAPAE